VEAVTACFKVMCVEVVVACFKVMWLQSALGDQIKKYEMGRACSTLGEERCIQGSSGET
jgi:hypothetical protein